MFVSKDVTLIRADLFLFLVTRVWRSKIGMSRGKWYCVVWVILGSPTFSGGVFSEDVPMMVVGAAVALAAMPAFHPTLEAQI